MLFVFALFLGAVTAQDVGPTPLCLDAYEDSGAVNFPSENVWATYLAENTRAELQFFRCLSQGNEDCTASLTNGVDTFEAACEAASGIMCGAWAQYSLNDTVGTKWSQVCLPQTCTDLYDLDEYGEWLAHLGICLDTKVYDCRVTSLDCGISGLSNEQLALIAIVSLLGVVLIVGVPYTMQLPSHARTSFPDDPTMVAAEAPLMVAVNTGKTEQAPKPVTLQNKIVSLACKAWDFPRNLQSVYHRPGDALASLDGMRAWAVLWVIALHTSIEWPLNHLTNGAEFETQMELVNSTAMLAVNHGNMGVDVFFVLSGFLITHMLLREQDKNGSIAILRFLRRRFMRLFPAYLAAFGLVWWIQPDQMDDCHEYWWTNMLFINNMWGLKNCLVQSWSIAIEMQFYLLSPFIVIAMAASWDSRRFWRHPNRALIIPVALSMYSCSLRLMFILNTTGDSGNYVREMDLVYTRMYTRVTPYLSGMAVAHIYNRCRDSWQGENWKGPIKWFCDAVFTFLWVGLTYWGTNNYPNQFEGDPPQWVVLGLLVFGRALFGLAISYFVLMTITGHAKLFNWILSWRVWVPVARLSYSAYLLQFIPVSQLESVIGLQDSTSLNESFGIYVALLWVVIPYTFALALVVYMLVEKPFMNLRL